MSLQVFPSKPNTRSILSLLLCLFCVSILCQLVIFVSWSDNHSKNCTTANNGSVEVWEEKSGPSNTQPEEQVVAEWVVCKRLRTSERETSWKEHDMIMSVANSKKQQESSGCGKFCDYIPYLVDRCVRPRTTCVLRPRIPRTTISDSGKKSNNNNNYYGLVASSTQYHEEKYPPGTPLLAGQYVVLLGAANAIGTLSKTAYDELIEKENIITTVNLGRGAASPRFYTDHWEAIEPIIVNAAAVVVSAMAIRSSSNDACEEERGCDAVKRMDMWRNSTQEERKIQEEQSFVNSMEEHRNLIQTFYSSTERLERRPKLILLWHSRCLLTVGCESPEYFPQWYTSQDRVNSLIQMPGWDVVVDGNYYHYPDRDKQAVFKIDKCDWGCDSRSRPESATNHWCDIEEFRQDARENGGCTKACGKVANSYYPVHGDKAAQNLLPVLKQAINERQA